MLLSTMSSISKLQILDEDGREGELDDNKPIEVNMLAPTFKQIVVLDEAKMDEKQHSGQRAVK